MNRRDIPAYDMNEAGPEHLRQTGILVMRFMASVTNDPRRLHPHVHDFFQMYLLQGNATVMLDFQEHEVSGTNAVFISPGQVHTVRMGEWLDGVTVSFTREFFDQQPVVFSQLSTFPFLFQDRRVPSLPLIKEQGQEIIHLFDSLHREFETGLADAADILRPTLHLLLGRLRRIYEQAIPTSRPTRAMQLVHEFQILLDQKFRQTRALPDYARELGITENHLNDIVKDQTGHSAGDLIRRRCLLHAKRLLLHSEESVAEIAYDLGFDDPSYFSRFFRRYEKVTPKEFRDQIREKYHQTTH